MRTTPTERLLDAFDTLRRHTICRVLGHKPPQPNMGQLCPWCGDYAQPDED